MKQHVNSYIQVSGNIQSTFQVIIHLVLVLQAGKAKQKDEIKPKSGRWRKNRTRIEIQAKWLENPSEAIKDCTPLKEIGTTKGNKLGLSATVLN